MRSRTFRSRAGITLALLAMVTSFVITAGASSEALTGPGAPPGRGQQYVVTLITGDRVLVPAGGDATGIVILPAQRRRAPVFFSRSVRNRDWYVIPSDAAGLILAGALDRELFNVSAMVRQGYDDGRVASVPLLVGYASPAAARGTPAPAGTSVRRALDGLAMTALDARKSGAARFWDGLVAPDRPGVMAGDARKVWLNRRVRATLDQSVPRIGVPAARGRGLTGAGVTVAVLDTGVDTDHPDLAGRVAVARDFSGTGSIEDGNGHGTHVAGVVAGSGVASAGRFRGVAPDVQLAVGKVLDDTGSGTFDAVLAGMQWAAVDVGARVVNVSLGGGWSDGTDPLSTAVNTLTRTRGTLFVTASGNDGFDESVNTPAVADDALAVASVGRTDVLSEFSSRGPRIGDGAAKPDIAAPGEGIAAARPAGIPPIGVAEGEAYQRLDGTSMATPHVSGVAALLAQQHPQWRATSLKDALMSTAVEVTGAGAFEVGTGRVDADRASRQPLTATGTVSTALPWPNLAQQRRQVVIWRNVGPDPVALTLTATLGADGQPAPAGMLALSAGTVIVPAGGSSTVDLTIAAQPGAAGRYAGTLVARSADGTITTRTVLAVFQEAEMYDVTVGLLDRNGSAVPAFAYPSVWLNDLDTGAQYFGSPGRFRVPAGRYSLLGIIETRRTGQEPTFAYISHPEIQVERAMTQTLDARQGKRLSIDVDNPAARGGYHHVDVLTKIASCICTFGVVSFLDPRFHEAYAATVPGTASPTYALGQFRRAHEPAVEIVAHDPQRFEAFVDWLDPSSPAPAERTTLRSVHGGSGTKADLSTVDVRGRLVVIDIPGETTFEELYARLEYVKQAGARLAVVNVTPGPIAAALARGGDHGGTRPAMPALIGFGPTTARLSALIRTGATQVAYASRPVPDLRYSLAYGVADRLTTAQVHHARTKDLVPVRTAYHDAVDSTPSVLGGMAFFGTYLGFGFNQLVTAPQERTEYFTPGEWSLSSGTGPWADLSDSFRFDARRRHRIAWNKAVAGPTIPPETFPDREHGGERYYAWRKDGAVDVVLPMLSDSAGRRRLPFPELGIDTGSISLHRNGALLGTIARPDRARFDVPTGAAEYRLTAETHRTQDWWPLWTTVSATWTFRSSEADDGKPLPLLTVQLDPPVDISNSAPGGRAFSFPALADPSINSLTVDVSYDDGRTWQPATVRRAAGHWTVSVAHPARGYASLRARAADANGNRVEQVVLRAYQLG